MLKFKTSLINGLFFYGDKSILADLFSYMVYNNPSFASISTMTPGGLESIQPQGVTIQGQSVSQNTQGIFEKLATATSELSMTTQYFVENHQVAQNEGTTTGITSKLAPDTAGIDGKTESAMSTGSQGITADNRTVSKGPGFLSRIIKNITSKITSCFTKKQDVQSRTVAKNHSSMSFFKTFGLYCMLKFSSTNRNEKLKILQAKAEQIPEKYRNVVGLTNEIVRITTAECGGSAQKLFKEVFSNKPLWNLLPETTKNEFGARILSDGTINTEDKLMVLKSDDSNGNLLQKFLSDSSIDIKDRLIVLKSEDTNGSLVQKFLQVDSNQKVITLDMLKEVDADGGLIKKFLESNAKADTKVELLMKIVPDANFFFQNDKDENGNLDLNSDFRKTIDQFLLSAIRENASDKRLVHLSVQLGMNIPMEEFLSTFGEDFVRDYMNIQAGEDLDTICQNMAKNPSQIVDFFGETGCCPMGSLSENLKAKLLESLSKMDLSKSPELFALKTNLPWSENMSVKEQVGQLSLLVNSLITNAIKPSLFQNEAQKIKSYNNEQPKINSIVEEATSTEHKMRQIEEQLDQVCAKLDQYKQMMKSLKNIASVCEESLQTKSKEINHPCRDVTGRLIVQTLGLLPLQYRESIKYLEDYQKIRSQIGTDLNSEKYKSVVRIALKSEIELGVTLRNQLQTAQQMNSLLQHYDPQSKTLNGIPETEIITAATGLLTNQTEIDSVKSGIGAAISKAELPIYEALMQAAGLSLS